MRSQGRLQLVKLIDNERRRMELTGLRASSAVVAQARTLAVGTWEATNDPARAADAAKRLLLAKLAPVVADGMVAGHLLGRLRTVRIAERHPRYDRRGLALSTSAYDGARKFLLRRLSLTEGELQDLRTQYNAAALRVTRDAATALELGLQEILLATLSEGKGVRDGVTALRETFTSQGMTPAADHQLESIFRTQTQTAYGAGRWNALQDPAVADITWGFEYASIRDERRTDLCEQLDGLVRPKADPVWQRYWPPNHWSCRSTCLELFDTGTPAGEYPTLDPQDGFGLNAGLVFQDQLAAAEPAVMAFA